MWGEHKYGIQDRIDEIQIAIQNELWQSALALSLTLPDICGQIEFKELVKENGNRLIGEQYKAWFRKYVEKYFEKYVPESINDELDENELKMYFTAEMCWELRNAFLHAGSDETSVNYEKNKHLFSLQLNSVNSYVIDKENNITSAHIDVAKLCSFICYGTTEFMDVWACKEDFDDHICTWPDIKKFHKEFLERKK